MATPTRAVSGRSPVCGLRLGLRSVSGLHPEDRRLDPKTGRRRLVLTHTPDTQINARVAPTYVTAMNRMAPARMSRETECENEQSFRCPATRTQVSVMTAGRAAPKLQAQQREANGIEVFSGAVAHDPSRAREAPSYCSRSSSSSVARVMRARIAASAAPERNGWQNQMSRPRRRTATKSTAIASKGPSQKFRSTARQRHRAVVRWSVPRHAAAAIPDGNGRYTDDPSAAAAKYKRRRDPFFNRFRHRLVRSDVPREFPRSTPLRKLVLLEQWPVQPKTGATCHVPRAHSSSRASRGRDRRE